MIGNACTFSNVCTSVCHRNKCDFVWISNCRGWLHNFFKSARWFLWEEFEGTKGVIIIRKSKKDRQHNDQTKKDKRINNDLQTITQKTKDRVTQTSLITVGELRCSGRVSSSCSTSEARRVNLVTNPVISHEWGKDREEFASSGASPRIRVHLWHRYSVTVNQVISLYIFVYMRTVSS